MADWTNLLGSGVVGVIAAAIVGAFANRRKLGAEANQGNAQAFSVQTAATITLLKQYEQTNQKQQREIDFTSRRLDAMEQREGLLLDWVREVIRLGREQQPQWVLPPEPVLPGKPEMDWGTAHEKG